MDHHNLLTLRDFPGIFLTKNSGNDGFFGFFSKLLRQLPYDRLKDLFAETEKPCRGDAIGISFPGSLMATVAGGGLTALATESLLAAGSVAAVLSAGVVTLCVREAKNADRKNKKTGDKINAALPAPEIKALPSPK